MKTITRLIFGIALLFPVALHATVTISNIAVASTTSSSATMTWTTSGNATSQVLYGLSGATDQSTPLDGTPVTSHSVTVSGLQQGVVYTYTVQSKDNSDNSTTTGTAYTFALCPSATTGVTKVTGTINVAYEYGNYTFTLVNDSGSVTSPTYCAGAVTTPKTGLLDLHGNLLVTMPDNNYIVPSPSHWSLAVSSFTGTGGAIGAFTVSPISLAGSTQDLTSSLQTGASGQLQHVIYDPNTAAFNPPISGSGTVTSVAATTTFPGLTIGGSPITGGGTFTFSPTTAQAANSFLATPNSSTGPLGLRTIVGGDLPAINLAASGAGGVTGNLPVGNLNGGSAADAAHFWAGDGTWKVPPGSGTVTSVGLLLPASLFTITNSPVISTGTLTGSFASISAHLYLGNNTASPATAALVQPDFTDLTGAATTGQLPFTYGGNTTKLATIGSTWTGTGATPCLDASGNLVTTGCTSGTVSSVFGRTGVVTAATNDYTLAQISATFSSPLSLASSTLSCPTCTTNAAALTANQLVLGGGAQATVALGGLGTTTTVLHGNAAGAPTFAAIVNADITNTTIDLTTKVTGILPTANGGTANAFFTVSGPASSAKTFTFPNASSTVLTSNAAVTVPQGGTGVGTFTAHGVLLGETTSNIVATAAGAADNVFMGQGASADPAYAALTDCHSAANAVTYNTSTHAWGCNTIAGSGTVNSATGNLIAIYATTGTAVSGDTLLSDNGTTLTYTGTGGVAVTSAVAGQFAYGQGTAASAPTNAVGVSGPTTVPTGYAFVLPSAAPTGFLRASTATSQTGCTASSTNSCIFAEASIDLTADVGATVLPGANGGTNNAFFAVTGPASSLKTFTFPNASATVLTNNASVTVGQGGTGLNTLTNHAVLVGAATAAITPVGPGTSGIALIGQGASADPAFGTVIVAGGGTGLATITAHGVMIGEGTGNVAPTAAGTAGIPLIGQGASADPVFGTAIVAGGGTGLATITAHGVMMGEGTSNVAPSSAGTAGQYFRSGGSSADGAYTDFPDVKTYPAANCVSTVAGSAWDTALAPVCVAGTNNLGGALPFVDTSVAQFNTEIPADWDSASQAFVNLFFTSATNTTGTAIFNVAIACTKADGSITNDPAFNTADTFATKTMAAASRAWSTSIQLTQQTSGNNCVAGGTMIVKITRATDTASAALHVTKATITTPRLLTVQAN